MPLLQEDRSLQFDQKTFKTFSLCTLRPLLLPLLLLRPAPVPLPPWWTSLIRRLTAFLSYKLVLLACLTPLRVVPLDHLAFPLRLLPPYHLPFLPLPLLSLLRSPLTALLLEATVSVSSDHALGNSLLVLRNRIKAVSSQFAFLTVRVSNATRKIYSC